MHCTGLGKAILALSARCAAANSFWATSWLCGRSASRTITDPTTLRLELESKRATRGYALDHEEIISGVHCVAVPILNHAWPSVGAISVAGTMLKTDGERLQMLVERLKTAGDYVSRRIGFTGQ